MQVKFASWKRGFTMIELLVVIAIIGVLAAAVLAAINPVEQINKGRDTARRSDAAELVNASERFYAVQEEWPWNKDNGSTWTGAEVIANTEDEFTDEAGGDWDWMDILETTNEVKSNFVNRVNDTHDPAGSGIDMFVVKEDQEGTVYVCFKPSSRQFRQEALDRCVENPTSLPDAIAVTRGDLCGTTPSLDTVHICVP